MNIRLIVIAAGIAPIALTGEPAIVVPAEVTHGPMLGRLTDTSVRVWMRTSRPSEIQVRHGTDPNRLDLFSEIGRTHLDHDNTGWVRLKGLQPDTHYYYRVNVPQNRRPVEELRGSFRTLPNSSVYRDLEYNPTGLFNFRFEFGCGNSQKWNAFEMTTFRTMLDRHADELYFTIQTGDWIYEEKREYPASAWLESQELNADNAPNVIKAAPVISGVWENYKVYLERSANLREWHRTVPAFYTIDDHELLGDYTGGGNIGLRDRRAVFRDIGMRGWMDYLAWSNPLWHEEEIVFGRGWFEAGSDMLHDPEGRFDRLESETTGTLIVLWDESTAGMKGSEYDVRGDPNAGVYAIEEVVDATRLRVRPAARESGEVAYSIGRPQYTSFKVANTEFFLLDTRSYRQVPDRDNPFNPEVKFLGDRQKAWLKNAMRASAADFLFVVSSVSVFLPHEYDGWPAAGIERREMLDFWNSLGKPVLLLTGDLHNSYAMRITERVWEFLSAPQNSNNTTAEAAGNPPPSGQFEWQGQSADIRWSIYAPDDDRKPLTHPVYCIVQVNNVFEVRGPRDTTRWMAYPEPQAVIQFYSGLTGELLYAESIVAEK